MMKIRRDRDESFVDFVRGQLEDVIDLQVKRMFGGHGVYAGPVFFAIIHKGCLYFKTNAVTQGRYEEAGMLPFQPSEKQMLRHYYQVPVAIIEDANTLQTWALESVAIAAEKA